jgi:hypothetical protein
MVNEALISGRSLPAPVRKSVIDAVPGCADAKSVGGRLLGGSRTARSGASGNLLDRKVRHAIVF